MDRSSANIVKLSLIKGDITNQVVDAITNAANEGLSHGAGLAKAIVDRGGQIIERESKAYVEQNGRLKVSENAVTSPGSMECNFLIHAVGPMYNAEGRNIAIVELFDCITKLIDRANDELYCTSLAVPPISSGIFGFPVLLCAQTIFEAIEQRLSQKALEGRLVLNDIRIVIIDSPTLQIAKKEMLVRYPHATTAKTPGDGDTEVDLKLPIIHPQGRRCFVDEAREKEPDERAILEAMRDSDGMRHEESKEQTIIECEGCHQQILFDFYMTHMEFECQKGKGGGPQSNSLAEGGVPDVIECRDCHNFVTFQSIQAHNRVCTGAQKVKCQICGVMIAQAEIAEHRKHHQSFPAGGSVAGRGAWGKGGPIGHFLGPAHLRPVVHHRPQARVPVKFSDLPLSTFNKAKLNPSVKEGDKIECQVCLLEYSNGESLVTFVCTHLFHEECGSDWFKKHPICPICKAKQEIDQE